jgi:hypothetical protein
MISSFSVCQADVMSSVTILVAPLPATFRSLAPLAESPQFLDVSSRIERTLMFQHLIEFLGE